MGKKFRKRLNGAILRVLEVILVLFYKLVGPPRILKFCSRLNIHILRTFGAKIGTDRVVVLPPLTLSDPQFGYANLTIQDGCFVNTNNYLDIAEKITLEEGVSLAPGVIIMTHNRYNYNPFLEEKLAHTCGKKPVLIKKGSGIKAGALITMGVTIGENAVIGGGAVVNRDIPDRCFAVGVPARVIKEIE